MKFEAVQHYDAGKAAVMALYADADYYIGMGAMPPLSAPDLLFQDTPDGLLRIQLRYQYQGDLPPGASRFISPDKLTWVQDSRIDPEAGTERIKIVPDHYPDRLEALISADYLESGGGTDRHIHGELHVHVPLVGGRVEHAIVDGLRDHLDAQAAAAVARLAE